MTAGLSATIRPSDSFAIEIDAPGVEPAYVAGAKNGVLTVLLSHSFQPVLGCRISLSDFRVDAMESSYAAFFAAGREATERLIGVFPGSEHNLEPSA